MSQLLVNSLLSGIDRFRKLRIGQLASDIDENGEVTVNWFDGEPGGQNTVLISFPGLNNSGSVATGVEIGHGKGTVGIFGFITDNHTVLLSTVISKIKGKQVGYDKTRKIKSGEVRATSKTGSNIFLDENGNVSINSTNELLITMSNGASLTFASDGKVTLDTPEEITINCKKFTVNTDSGITTH